MFSVFLTSGSGEDVSRSETILLVVLDEEGCFKLCFEVFDMTEGQVRAPAAQGCILEDAYSYLQVGADYHGLCCGFA